MFKNKKMKKGFTLVELIIVMVILGALAAIAIPKMGGSKDGAILSSVKSDVRMAIAKANEEYSKVLDYSTVGNLTSSGSHANALSASPGNVITVAPGSTNATFTVTVTRASGSDCSAATLIYDSSAGFKTSASGTASAAIPTLSCS